MRLHLWQATAFALLVCMPAQGAAAEPVTAPALRALVQGQSYERLFQDSVEPSTCGIVLERARCVEDFKTLSELRGPEASDAAMKAWLASGDISLAVKDWNGNFVTDTAWSSDPTFAWWYTAGRVSICASLPAAATDYVASCLSAISIHSNVAPPTFQNAIESSGSPFERLRPWQAALSASVP